MMKNNLFIINKGGYKYIGYALLATFIFIILDLELFSFITFGLGLFFIYVFRNPERESFFLDEKAVVSPIDGVVKAIDELKNKEYSYKVTIEASYLNVGVLRVPLNGKIEDIKVSRGARTSKHSKLFHDLNETAELIFIDGYNNKIKVVHRLKQSFAPLNIEVSKNDVLQKNSRYGYGVNMISELYLPKNFRFDIRLNSEIRASQSLIGYFT